MEGVAFSLRDVFELIKQTDAHPEVIHLSGGGSASSVWRQIFADVLNRQVLTLDYSEDAGAVGAAVIAGLATGIWSSCQQAVERIPVQTVNDPITGNIKLYNDRFEVYQEVYPALRSIYEKLATTL
jgi:xylulokinase